MWQIRGGFDGHGEEGQDVLPLFISALPKWCQGAAAPARQSGLTGWMGKRERSSMGPPRTCLSLNSCLCCTSVCGRGTSPCPLAVPTSHPSYSWKFLLSSAESLQSSDL